jgi:hypothetical protein
LAGDFDEDDFAAGDPIIAFSKPLIKSCAGELVDLALDLEFAFEFASDEDDGSDENACARASLLNSFPQSSN